LDRPGAGVSLSHFFLELIKHKVVYLISALSMALDCHFNLLEPIWIHKIVAWSFFVFITLHRNEKQAHVFGLMCARARSDLADFLLLVG
jgi:hypothetical protein